MDKLTLEDLKRKYADRPENIQPAEVEKLEPTPVPVEPDAPEVISVKSTKRKTMSSVPLFVFVVFAGVGLSVGLGVLLSKSLHESDYQEAVLGEQSVQKGTLVPRRTGDVNGEVNIEPFLRNLYNVLNEEDPSQDVEVEEDTVTKVIVEEVEELEEILSNADESKEADSVIVVRVKNVEGGYVKVRQDPLSGAITRVASGSEFNMLDEILVDDHNWVEVQIDDDTKGWIRSDLVEKL